MQKQVAYEDAIKRKYPEPAAYAIVKDRVSAAIWSISTTSHRRMRNTFDGGINIIAKHRKQEGCIKHSSF